MNHELQQAKRMIRPYLSTISETGLWQLCAMAKDGKIQYSHRCHCIRGIVGGESVEGYYSENSDLAVTAESGLQRLGLYADACDRVLIREHRRNIRLLPMVQAEIRRRERMAAQQPQPELAAQPSPEFAGRREE